jgi:hypothetical protein
MSQQMAQWLIGSIIFAVVEALLVWKITKTLRLGTISFDPFFWFTTDYEIQAASRLFNFKITAVRATHPIFFWLLTGIVIAFAAAVAAFFLAAATGRLA